MMQKTLPRTLTSYDLLKTLAIFLMVIDHAGFYFFDNDTWFRVLGRLCVPIWFFLIGYARSKDVPMSVYIGAALIAAGNVMAGEYILPLSILITLMIGRLYKDAWMRAVLKGGDALKGLFFIFLLAYIPSEAFFEYGTVGFYFVIFGALMRLQQDSPELYTARVRREGHIFVALGFILFVLSEAVKFTSFTWAQFALLVVGMAGVYWLLRGFKGQTLEKTHDKTPSILIPVLQFTGRQTLWIYVGHLLIFKAAALYLFPERFTAFDWSFFRPGFIDFVISVLSS